MKHLIIWSMKTPSISSGGNSFLKSSNFCWMSRLSSLAYSEPWSEYYPFTLLLTDVLSKFFKVWDFWKSIRFLSLCCLRFYFLNCNRIVVFLVILTFVFSRMSFRFDSPFISSFPKSVPFLRYVPTCSLIWFPSILFDYCVDCLAKPGSSLEKLGVVSSCPMAFHLFF